MPQSHWDGGSQGVGGGGLGGDRISVAAASGICWQSPPALPHAACHAFIDPVHAPCPLPQNMAGAAALLGQALVAVAHVFSFANVHARYNEDDFTVTFAAAARLGYPPNRPINVSNSEAKRINAEIKRHHPNFERGWRSTKLHLTYNPHVAGTEFIRHSERIRNRLDKARVERYNAVELLLHNTQLHDALDKEKKQLMARLREINAKKGQLQARHTVLEKDAADKDKNVQELEKEKETLQTKVAELETNYAEVVNKIDDLEKKNGCSTELANLSDVMNRQSSAELSKYKLGMSAELKKQAQKLEDEGMEAAKDAQDNEKKRSRIELLYNQGKYEEATEAAQKMRSELVTTKKPKGSNNAEASSSKAPMRNQLALME